MVKGINAGAQTPVKTENLSVDQGCEWQVVEKVGEVLPDVGVSVFAQALVVKSVHLGDLTRFMVATEDCNTFAVTHLKK